MQSKLSLLSVMLIWLSLLASAQPNIDLKPEKTQYHTGDRIKLTFSTSVPLAQKSWVGLFPSSVAAGSHRGYVTYIYVHQQTSKVFEFDAPEKTGDYEFRIFAEEYGAQVKSVAFKVVPIDPALVSIELVTQQVKPSQPFKVRVTTEEFEFNARAWLGLYKAGLNPEDYRGYETYQYLRNRQGNVLTLNASAEVGDYELRLYASDRGQMIKRMNIHIGTPDLKGIGFTLNKSAYDPEEDIVITYQGHSSLTDRAWLGTFHQDASEDYREYLSYQYLRPKTAGTAIIKAPSTKGPYQVRLFYADQGPQLLDPVSFEVTHSLNKEYLKESLESTGKVLLYGIYFDTDKSIIKASSYPLINEIAAMLKADANLRISIEGHTDSQGDEDYNQKLSEARAAAVRKVLISEHQIPSSQLESRGHGEKKPVEDNSNAAGRAKNRRVELVRL